MVEFACVIEEDNFTDLYKALMLKLLKDGIVTEPRGMKTYELMNANLVLTNPRERLLYSRVRKHSYTYASAEFLWYLVGNNSLSFIEYYLPRMKEYSDDGVTVNSAYGYRIFGHHEDFPNQWQNVMSKLLNDQDTRQAIITIHYQKDIDKPSKDVPCTLNLHFMIRNNRLNMFTQMRSNDSYMGLIYDVFSFTLLQEHMLNLLRQHKDFPKLELGTYVHKSDSMHLYDRDIPGVKRVLNEEWDEVCDLEIEEDKLRLHSHQLGNLCDKEKRMRLEGIKIPVENYDGMCRFIAEKLNRKLE